MFNDKYGLTQAVLEGRKTMTRRVCKGEIPLGNWAETEKYAPYQVGEVVAIAQSYESILCDLSISDIIRNEISDNHSGYKNKMFVKAELMPHHIKITNIRVERLQDISDEDCLREGIRKWDKDGNPLEPSYDFVNSPHGYATPREAFAALIDKVSGRGTWDSNPMVWVYEFELVD